MGSRPRTKTSLASLIWIQKQKYASSIEYPTLFSQKMPLALGHVRAHTGEYWPNVTSSHGTLEISPLNPQFRLGFDVTRESKFKPTVCSAPPFRSRGNMQQRRREARVLGHRWMADYITWQKISSRFSSASRYQRNFALSIYHKYLRCPNHLIGNTPNGFPLVPRETEEVSNTEVSKIKPQVGLCLEALKLFS